MLDTYVNELASVEREGTTKLKVDEDTVLIVKLLVGGK